MTPEHRQSLPLFATPVFAYDLEPARAVALNMQLAAGVERLFTPRPQVVPGQNFQTHHDLLHHKGFEGLQPVIAAAVDQTLAKLAVQHRGWRVTGSWANMNPPGIAHAPHGHPNNLLAGVYYVRTGSGADSIRFHNPRPQLYATWPTQAEATPVNASYWQVTTMAGRVIVFPAWFMHSVPVNRGRIERISISFNVMLEDAETVMPPLAWRDLGG